MKRLVLFMLAFTTSAVTLGQQAVVLKGGTIIDVTDFGKSTRDVSNSVVVIEGNKITAAGKASTVKIPKGARVIDVRGKYIVPGLIDCFGIINNQAYANAYLYMGVTTAVMTEDDRRGKADWTVKPAPAMPLLDNFWGARARRVAVNGVENVGFEIVESWSNDDIDRRIDSLGKAGVKVLLVHYAVVPSQFPAIVAACKRNGIATIGELGMSSYKEAVAAGIASFVHTSRYTADLLPDSARKVYGMSPFGPAGRYYYEYIAAARDVVNERKFQEIIKLYHDHTVGLIPTAAMLEYPMMDFAVNPWQEPAAAIINEKDVEFEPLDKVTGKWTSPASVRQRAVKPLLRIDSALASNGARYLTGSGADAFGALPGVSLHYEIEMLHHMGLSNREALAAATHNFSLLWNWTHVGKIEAGREADILVLDNNPLLSLKNLRTINVLVVDGEIIDREALVKQ